MPHFKDMSIGKMLEIAIENSYLRMSYRIDLLGQMDRTHYIITRFPYNAEGLFKVNFVSDLAMCSTKVFLPTEEFDPVR